MGQFTGPTKYAQKLANCPSDFNSQLQLLWQITYCTVLYTTSISADYALTAYAKSRENIFSVLLLDLALPVQSCCQYNPFEQNVKNLYTAMINNEVQCSSRLLISLTNKEILYKTVQACCKVRIVITFVYLVRWIQYGTPLTYFDTENNAHATWENQCLFPIGTNA